jgi:hypothetical protein
LSLLDLNILLSTLFSSILGLCSSLDARGQVLHPCNAADKSVVSDIIFYFLPLVIDPTNNSTVGMLGEGSEVQPFNKSFSTFA